MNRYIRAGASLGLIGLLMGSASRSFAQKGVRPVLKTPRYHAVKPPILPATTSQRIVAAVERMALQQADLPASAATTALVHPRPLSPCPGPILANKGLRTRPDVANFLQWFSTLEGKKYIATQTTAQALEALRIGLVTYEFLEPEEQAQIDKLWMWLDSQRSRLGKFDNGDFFRLVYHANEQEGKFPQIKHFHLEVERAGMYWRFGSVQKINQLPLQTLSLMPDHTDPDFMLGIAFLQGFQLPQVRQELEQVLDILADSRNLTVRMSPHELGLTSENRQKFREGRLHIHFEKPNAKPGPVPIDMNVELWLSAQPIAGVIDVHTRKIIAPFSDKTIAQNYLFLFEKYLTPDAKAELRRLSW